MTAPGAQQSDTNHNPSPLDTRLFRIGIVVCAIAVLILSVPLFAGKIYTYGDLGRFHLPLRAFYQECLVNGESFLWWPDVFCGYYAHGEGQAGFYHPFHYLLYRFLPLQIAFNLELLLCYPLMLLGGFLLLRRWGLDKTPALFGAFVFAFSGFALIRSTHMHLVEMAAHTPWLLLLIDVAFTTPSARRRIVCLMAITLLTLSQVLIGYPQMLYVSGLAEGVYTLVLAVRTRRIGLPLHLLAAKTLGVLLGAVQLLPTYAFLMDSDRLVTAEGYRQYLSLHPLNVLQWMGPYLFAGGEYAGNLQEFSVYAGAVTTLLIVWLAVRFRHLGQARWAVLGLALFGMGMLVVSFGAYSGASRVLARIPLLNYFKGPCRHLLLVHLVLAGLAAFAFQDVMQVAAGKAQRGKNVLWALGGALAVSWALAGAFWYANGHGGSAVARWVNNDASGFPLVLWGAAIGTGALVLLVAALRWRPWVLGLVFVVAAADQTAYGLYFLYYWDTPTSVDAYANRYPAPDAPGGRLMVGSRPETNVLTVRGYALANGLAGLFPRKRLAYDSEASLRAAGVAWLEKLHPRIPTNDAFQPETDRWRPVAESVPRVYVVGGVKVSEAPARDIDTIDVKASALVEEALNLAAGEGTAELLDDHPGDIRIGVQASSRQLLVLVESFHEGWQAAVISESGEASRKVLRVNGDFMGVVVEPGDREIRFLFNPPSLRRGRHSSLAALLAGLAYYGVLSGWARRQKLGTA